MNLRQIEVFRATMLTGSVTEAARYLHVSQPGISRMLAHLELRLGFELFERRKGRLLPTPQAQALYAEVEQVYGGVKRIQDCAEALKSGDRLTLRVVASPSTGQEMVPLAVARLAARYPAAKIFMEILPLTEMVRQMAAHEADVAISTLRIDHALLGSQLLGRWRLVCVFPKGHAFEQRRTLSLRDIVAQPLISFSPETPQGRIIVDWCERHQVTPKSSIQVRAGQAACALAACGAGVAIVDDLTARAHRTDRLSFRPLPQTPQPEIFAVTHNGFAPSLLARDFIGLAAQGLQEIRGGKPVPQRAATPGP